MKKVKGNNNFVSKHESSIKRHIRHNLAKHIRHTDDYPLTLEELMKMFGLKYDGKVIKDYNLIETFLVDNRKSAMKMFNYMIESGWFDAYKDNGHSEKEIYQGFINKCVYEEPPIIPLYSDADRKLKLITLESFIEMLESRLKASGKELERKFGYLKSTSQVLPKTINAEIELLSDDPNFEMLKDARDELNRFLPEHSNNKNDNSDEGGD